MPAADPVTALLKALDDGSDRRVKAAVNAVIPLVEDELRRQVRLQMNREGGEITVHPIALVNEVVPLFGDRQRFEHRAHVLAIAAGVVRRVLVDIARTRVSLDRADRGLQVGSDEALVSGAWSDDLIALDAALIALAARDARQSQIAELRVFGGLTIEDICDAIDVAPATIKHGWHAARAALAHELERMDRWAVGPSAIRGLQPPTA